MKATLLSLLFTCAASCAFAQPDALKVLWSHGTGGGGGGACPYNDGSPGAPAGAVAIYATVLNGYAHAPANSCKWPDVGYGVGATGLGTPMIVSSVSGSTIVVTGSIPGYLTTGETVYDISSKVPGSIIPAADTITSINTGAHSFTLTTAPTNAPANGDAIAAFNPVTCTGVTGTCTAWTPPANVSVDTTSKLLRVTGTNVVITGADLSPDGGFELYPDTGCSNLTVTNDYDEVGSNQLDLFSSRAQCTGGGTVTDVTVDGNGNIDSNGVNALIGIYNPGAWVVEYDRTINAFSDCYNFAPTNSTITPTLKFTSCINNGAGNVSGAHADWVQEFGAGTATIASPTDIQNTWIMDSNNLAGNNAASQGIGCGDGATCTNPDVETNLVVLKLTNPGSSCGASCTTGVNHVFQIDRSASLGTATYINNWVDPTFLFGPLLSTFSTGGTIVESGNTNIITGAIISP